MTSDNMDWHGCHAWVYCREAKTLRYCGNKVREGREFCGRHQPRSRKEHVWKLLVSLCQRVRQAVNAAVLTLKRWVG